MFWKNSKKDIGAISLYDTALKLSSVNDAETILNGIDLKSKDTNGNTFLDCVIKNNELKYFHFCYANDLFQISENGQFLIDGNANKDLELAMMFWHTLDNNAFDNTFYKNAEVSKYELNTETISKRKFTKPEIELIVKKEILMQNLGTFGSIDELNAIIEQTPDIVNVIMTGILFFNSNMDKIFCEVSGKSVLLDYLGGLSDEKVNDLIKQKILVNYNNFNALKNYCSAKAYEKYSSFFYSAKQIASKNKGIASVHTEELIANKMYDEVIARKQALAEIEKQIATMINKNNSQLTQEIRQFCNDVLGLRGVDLDFIWRSSCSPSYPSNSSQTGRIIRGILSEYESKCLAKVGIRHGKPISWHNTTYYIPPSDIVLKTGNAEFIKNYFLLCHDVEKDVALNNYKDGDLTVIKALLETGANFLIAGHSDEPSAAEAYNPDYQERRDKTKTALIKMQFGLK